MSARWIRIVACCKPPALNRLTALALPLLSPLPQLTLTGGYTRGTALVRSCFVPPPHTTAIHTHTHNPYTGANGSALAAPGLLLASTDEASRCPLLWSLASRAVVQALDPHPMAPTCLAAVALGQGLGAQGSYGGYDCLLAAASQTQVALYRRRE